MKDVNVDAGVNQDKPVAFVELRILFDLALYLSDVILVLEMTSDVL